MQGQIRIKKGNPNISMSHPFKIAPECIGIGSTICERFLAEKSTNLFKRNPIFKFPFLQCSCKKQKNKKTRLENTTTCSRCGLLGNVPTVVGQESEVYLI